MDRATEEQIREALGEETDEEFEYEDDDDDSDADVPKRSVSH